MKTIFKVFSADLFAKLITMLTTILLIRVMTAHDYADYTVFVAIVNIFSQIAISSFGKMYIVDYEKMKGCESTILLIELLLSGAIVFAFLFLQPVVRDNIWGLCLLMVTTCIFGYARVVFQQQCKFGIYTLLEIIRVLLFLMMIGGCFLNKNVKVTASLVIGFQCLSLASAMPSLIKKISGIKWIEPIRVRKVFTFILQKDQVALFVYAALLAILLQIDVLVLKTRSTDYYVSAYSSALKYYNMMLMLLTTVNSVLLPKISMTEDYREIKKMYRQQDILAVVLLVGIIFAVVIAPFILPILDGGKYPESIGVFRILCFSALVSFWGAPYNNLLIKEKRYFSICIRFAAGIVIAILGNYFLIPVMGVNGTAIVTLVSYGSVNISSRIHAKKIIEKRLREQEHA